MKNKYYLIINLFFLLLTFLTIMIINPFNKVSFSIDKLLLLIIVLVCIHIFKCLRQYLLLIESGIHITDFIKIYIKTTFCSIILPYKTGEIYKAYEYGLRASNYTKGIITIIIDKLFDAIILILIFIPIELNKHQSLSGLTWILLIFVLLFIIIYSCFQQTYYYLNKHFILHSNSKRTIYVLDLLEKCNQIYKYIHDMLEGRILLLALFTVIAWTFEYLFILILETGDIISYINAVFFGTTNMILNNYIIIAMMCFIVLEIIFFLKK